MAAGDREDDHADEHACARGSERMGPTVVGAHIARGERGKEGADVDAQVKDAERVIAARIARRVEPADHR